MIIAQPVNFILDNAHRQGNNTHQTQVRVETN